MKKKVTLTLVIGIALVLALAAFTLTHSPPRVLAANGTGEDTVLAQSTGDIALCQGHEALPADTTAVRLSMWAFLGWRIRLKAYRGSHVLTEGARGADWTSDSVTVPVKPLDHAASDLVLCFQTGPNSEPALILGRPTPARDAAVMRGASASAAPREGTLPGKVGVEYLGAGRGSWWSRALSVARHIGLGRAFSGTWIALLIAALTGTVGVLALGLTLRELP